MRLVHDDQPIGVRFSSSFAASGSELSRSLQLAIDKVNCHLRTPAAAYGAQWYVGQEIDRVQLEASAEDWDGEGAAAVEPSTAEFAKEFVAVLPSGLPTPAVEAGSHGEIMLEWRSGRRRVVIVSLYPNRSVGYSIVKGLARSYGREPFAGLLPEVLVTHLRASLHA